MHMAGKMKKYAERTLDELLFSAELAGRYSLRDAAVVLAAKADIQRSVRMKNLETPAMKRRLMYKHRVMSRYFAETFADYLRGHTFDAELPAEDPGRIWLFWWQGEEHAPEIVKTCIASVRRHAGGHPVTVLTEENLGDYVDVPERIRERLDEGTISVTHFSDVVRISLLASRGGLWLDATTLCTGSLEDCFAHPVWSIRRPDYLHLSPACGRFANYALAASGEGRRAFAVIRDLLMHYWDVTERMNDYLFLDYLILLACRADKRTRDYFENIPANNPCCDDLLNSFGEAYDAGKWAAMKKDTGLFKLTWKLHYPDTRHGQVTFCGKMRRGELE